MPFSGVRVEGLAELNRALGKYEKALQRELRSELRKAAEPVRSDAETRAGTSIRNLSGAWAEMRVGVTGRNVYVAPKARRRGGSPRPNLGGLLIHRAMEPAVDAKRGEVLDLLDNMLDRLGNQSGF